MWQDPCEFQSFFCDKFRKKPQEERKAIINLCILCLGFKNGKHDCPVTKCARCGAMHNVLLCPTDEEDRAFILNENLGQSEWTENEEALVKPEMCYMIKKVQLKEHSKKEKNQITGVKNALKELSSEQKTY